MRTSSTVSIEKKSSSRTPLVGPVSCSTSMVMMNQRFLINTSGFLSNHLERVAGQRPAAGRRPSARRHLLPQRRSFAAARSVCGGSLVPISSLIKSPGRRLCVVIDHSRLRAPCSSSSTTTTTRPGPVPCECRSSQVRTWARSILNDSLV